MERDVWLCAVSLDFLTEFASSIPENFSTADVVEKVIKPATAKAKCRYVDLVPACHVGHSTYFISHRWGCNFRTELVAVLVQRFGVEAAAAQSGPHDPQQPAAALAPGQAPMLDVADTPAKAPTCGTVDGTAGPTAESQAGLQPASAECRAAAAVAAGGTPLQSASSAVFLWLDIFAVNQWPNTTQADDLANLQNVIRHSRATVMLLDPHGAVLTRIWCLYEAWKTAEYKGPGGLQMLAPLSAVHYSALESVFVRLDVMAAEATVEADRVRILAEVAASMGAAALNVYIKGALVDSAIIESNAAVPAASAIAAPILQAISTLRQQEREAEARQQVAAQAPDGSEAAAPPTGTLAPPTAPPPPPPPRPMFTLSQEETVTLLRGAAACFRAARMLQFVANLRSAETLIREALALFTAAEGGAGGQHSLACLQALANILMPMKGRLDEARAVLQATLTASVKVHGPRHDATAAVVNDLGLLDFWREDWAGAEQHFKLALAIYEERRGAMPAEAYTEAVLAGRMSLGVVVAKQGPHRADEAEATLMSVLEGYSQRAGGKADQGVAEARGHLGKLAEARGRHDQAEEHFAHAAALSRQIFGSQHPAVADALAGIARQLAATGRLRGAVELSRAAHATALAALGPGGSGLVDRLAAQLADHETKLAAAAAAVEGATAGGAAAGGVAAGDAGPATAEGQVQEPAAPTAEPAAAVVTAISNGVEAPAAIGVESSSKSSGAAAPLSAGGAGEQTAVERSTAAPVASGQGTQGATEEGLVSARGEGSSGHAEADGGARGAAGGGEVADGRDGEGRPASSEKASSGRPAERRAEARPPSGIMAVSAVHVVRPASGDKAAGGSNGIGVGKGREGRHDDGCTAEDRAVGMSGLAAAEKAIEGNNRHGAGRVANATVDSAGGGSGGGGGGDDAVSGGCGAAACLPPRWRRSGSGAGVSNRVAPAP